jgi:NADH:ubiquinone oxidoreductase subunit K
MIFLITTEVMFLGLIIVFVVLSTINYVIHGQIIALIILTLAAIETAIGLCILIQAKMFINKLSFSLFHTLNG